MSLENLMPTSIKIAVVDVNGTLASKDYRWNHELVKELQNYSKIIVVSGAVDKEEVERYIPPSLIYDELHVKPGVEITQVEWKMLILNSIPKPFVLYDDNEVLIRLVQEKYGVEYGILVTGMGGGGYTGNGEKYYVE